MQRISSRKSGTATGRAWLHPVVPADNVSTFSQNGNGQVLAAGDPRVAEEVRRHLGSTWLAEIGRHQKRNRAWKIAGLVSGICGAWTGGFVAGQLTSNRRAAVSRQIALQAVLLAEQAGVKTGHLDDAAWIWRLQAEACLRCK